MIGKPRMPDRKDTLSLFAEDGVERAIPGGAPTAFRIWRFGENMTDHGRTVFSERSAALLLDEQAARGNLYSIDVNHMSLTPDAPIANQRAVGWHVLEVREGDGLWAAQVEWAEDIKAGLTCDPPSWRYYSPAYDIDKNTFEVTSYVNTAITNTPATWGATALATRTGATVMAISKSDMVAFLEHASKNQEGASAICDAILAVLSSASKKAEAPTEEPAEDPKKGEPADEDPEAEDKKASRTDTRVLALLESLQAERDAEKAAAAKAAEAAERKQILASRVIANAELKAWMSDESTPIQSVRDAARALPKAEPVENPAAAQFVTASRRAPDGVAADIDPKEVARMNALMGIRDQSEAIRFDAENRVGYLGVLYGAQGKAEAERILARRAAKGGA